MTTTSSTPAIASGVAATIGGLFATIEAWRDALERRLAAGIELSAAAVDPVVEALVAPVLDGDTLITGAGFVATPGILSDAEWHLAWWQRRADSRRRLGTIDDPTHEQFRDYTALEWWRVPERTGVRHLTGPYVDYVCTDDYTVTVTTPVTHEGRLVGLVGTDALVDRLERELLPLLRSSGGTATLVNASGRVITSTDTRREPGSILRLEGLAEAIAAVGASASTETRTDAVATASVTLPGGAEVVACGDTSLMLVLQ